MNKPIVITKTETITLPPPPETHYYIPHRDEGITIRKGDLLCSTFFNRKTWVPADSATWAARLKLPDTCYLARPRPYNPENLTDEILASLPDNARWISKEEWRRLKDLGGLRVEDEALLWYLGGEWLNHTFGGAADSTYATLHPKGYYLTLPEEHFKKGKQKLEEFEKAKATMLEGCELVEDPEYVIKEGDWIWSNDDKMWESAEGCIGMTVKEAAGNGEQSDCAYTARPKAKLVEWDLATVPLQGFYLRRKGDTAIYLPLSWNDIGVDIIIGPQTYSQILAHYEWSLTPKVAESWQPCGRYVATE